MKKIVILTMLLLVSCYAWESIEEALEEQDIKISELNTKYDHLDSRIVQIYNGMFKLDVTSWAHKIFVILSIPLNAIVTWIIIRITLKSDLINCLYLYNLDNSPVLSDLDKMQPKQLAPLSETPKSKTGDDSSISALGADNKGEDKNGLENPKQEEEKKGKEGKKKEKNGDK